MQLRALRYFNEVAQCVSLRKAATRLYVTPSAVSRQIEQLEHFYGASLIERNPRGIRLTREGEFLAQAINATLRELDHVKEHIANSQGVVAGTIRMFVSEGLISSMLAPVLAKFSQQYPKVQFQIETGSAPRIADAFRAGEADIGLTFYMPPCAEIEVTHHCDLWHRVLVPQGHPFTGRHSITIKDLAGQPLAIPNSTFSTRQIIEAAARKEGVRLNVAYTTSSVEVQKCLARTGIALLVLPQAARQDRDLGDGLVAVPLLDPLIERVRVDLCLPRQRTASIAIKTCQSMLAQIMADCSI
ncbi:LysR family transcriptional regulator [Brenneria izadpanahii]|uniref:LysR family transcriptional regulator n=1 Tax=Brenneria izadpanahii TaxID=2722756 RepID=A0ABX7UPW9_9GAMM|nr:LysR family transcriptional regulator [Brenneria izadpanahii]QTF06582.1 LysR family transcriptional regulator [Brenneria izadpanahii]